VSDGVARQRRRIPAPWVDVGARLLALSIGAGTSVQSFFMAEGSRRFGADRAALVTFGVAALVAAVWSTASRPGRGGAARLVADLGRRRLPWWAALGGVGGALFVIAQGVAVEPLGVAVFGVTFLAARVPRAGPRRERDLRGPVDRGGERPGPPARPADGDRRERRGKPGAVIYLAPGDYRLRTQVRIDISFLRIEGSGHGFTSSSIRFNVPEPEWTDLHELCPGGSRILVDIPLGEDDEESAGAAFYVERDGSPRLSSVEFSNVCIDGLHFDPDGSDLHPENTYLNGKTGILVAGPNDSFRVISMGFVYLEHALTVYIADALSVHDNFLAECGSCIEMRGWGQASKITDNLIGAGFRGYSIYAENHGGLLITANNVFPRGASSIHLRGVSRSSITGNRLHSFYPAMVVLEDSSENLIGSNHALRDHEPWTPFLRLDNGGDDVDGLLRVSGRHNSIIGNHFSEVVDSSGIRPPRGRPPSSSG